MTERPSALHGGQAKPQMLNLLRVPGEVTGRENRSGTIEALAVVSDVKAGINLLLFVFAGMEADWPTGTWRLEETGGTDMVEDGPRRTKAYDVTVYDKSEHRPCKSNNSLLKYQ